MAREHLYKAKRKDNGEWVYGDFIHSWHKKQTKSMPMIYNNMGKFEIDRETVCEYTGLKDKFGTKVFEGDIVRYCNGFGFIAYVESHCAYMCIEENGLYREWIDNIFFPSLEVIGNKFDNNLEV